MAGAGEKMTTTFYEVPPHTSVQISFKLALLDSWDQEHFYVIVDGVYRYDTYTAWQWHNAASDRICATDSWPDTFVDVSLNFAHTATAMTIVFTSSLDQVWWDESWGICNFNLYFAGCGAGQYNYNGGCVNSCPFGTYISGSNCVACTTSTCISGTSTMFSCSNPAHDTRWTYNGGWTTVACGGYNFVGPYTLSNYLYAPTLYFKDSHAGVKISFLFGSFDSWDHERFVLRVNGIDTFQVRPCLDRGSRTQLCRNTAWNDQLDRISVGVNHTAQTMSLQFFSELNQDAWDESWGICDLQITAYPYQVDKYGNPLDGGNANYNSYVTYFSCSNAARDAGWDYWMGYTRQACGGRWYLGGFGSGEYLQKDFHELPTHASVHIRFQFASIDSWDWETFYVNLDNTRIVTKSYQHDQSNRVQVCGQACWRDFLELVDVETNHNKGFMRLTFGSTLDQYWTDEAWGICDLQIWFNKCPVGQFLQGSSCVSSCSWGYVEERDTRTCVSCASAGTTCVSSGTKIYPSNAVKELPGWTYNQGFKTTSCAGYNFLGKYGSGGIATGPVKITDPHKSIIMSFRLAPIDSWDYEHFYISADNVLVFDQYFWTYADGKSNICHSGWWEEVQTFTIGFAHSSPDLTLKFWSSLDQAADDEAWGIGDITFTLTDCQVDKWGRCKDNKITGNTLTAFACSSGIRENDWDYVPYYSKIQCGGNWYAGRFANGGSMSTNFFGLPTHQALTFQFNLAMLDSWVGETFYFKVDNTVVYSKSYSTQGSNVCGAGYGDSFFPVTVTIGHQASTLNLQFYSNAKNTFEYQGWGICDLKILINSCPANQVLHGTTCVSSCPWGMYALPTDRICQNCVDGSPCVKDSYNFIPSTGPKAITGWTYTPSFRTYQCSGDGNRHYLRYGIGESVSGRLYMGAQHTAVILSFRFLSLDSWDWEHFNIKADGQVVFSESFWYGEDGRVQMCGLSNWLDDTENYITAFNHTSQTLDLEFSSTLNQDLSDESWGITDFTVTLVKCSNNVGVDNFGRCLNSVSNSRTYTVFSCQSPLKDLYWNYEPGYATYGCNAETFVGRYGAGGSVSTFFRGVPSHQSVVVKFHVLATDKWNSQKFIVKADGKNVYDKTFTWSDDARRPLCGNTGTYQNDMVDTVEVAFNHNLNQLGLTFTSNLDQSFQSQGWGICNVEVSFNVCPVGKFLTGDLCVDVCPWGQYPDALTKNCLACTTSMCADLTTYTALTLMPCSNPAKLSQFTYVAKYQTVKSGTNTYVGPFTQGDYISGPVYFKNPHSGVMVSFNLFTQGTWNHVFTVQADGKTVFAETVKGSKTIVLGFNHTTTLANLKFFAGTISTSQTWSICDLAVTPMDVPVDKYGQGIPTVDSDGDLEITKSMYNTIQQIACLCSSGSALPATFLNSGYIGLVAASTGGKFSICDIAKASYCFISCGECLCNGKKVTSPSAQALEAVVLKTSAAKKITCPGGCKDTFSAGKTYTGESFAADCANFNVNNVKYKVTQTSTTTLTQTMIVEKRADADDNQPKPTKPPRSHTGIDFGPTPPVTTCSSQVFQTTTVTSDLINILGDATISASNNFTLTSGKKNQRSAIWYKKPVDITKGFKVEFMLNLLNPTCTKITFTETRNYQTTDCTVTTDTFDNTITNKVCTNTPKTEILTYQKDSDNCGSEGVAFVIQPNNPNQLGNGGAGLGYEGILNALAIEFDASYNYIKNDPDNTKERHISIILKKGAADGNEDNSIAWNDKPLDFKAWDMTKGVEAGQVVNPLVRIEYMGYQIRVYLNNILQLSYSYQLNLAKELGLSSPQFYVGFTGSTSELVQTSSIFAWSIGEVQPYADTSIAEIYYPSGATQEQINNFMAAGTPFDVYITVKDKCSNSYSFTDLSKINLVDVNGIKVFGNNTCTLLKKEVNTNNAVAAHFRLSISCTVAKLNYVNIQFDGRAIRDQPLMWRTIAGPVSKANLLFDVDNKKAIGSGNTDNTFVFMLNLSDAYGNVVNPNPLQVVSALKITWPNPSDSKATHTAVFSTDTNLYYVFVDADKTGTYTISSPWFANSRTYQFVINGGLANASTSSVELVDAGFKPLTSFNGLQAGQHTVRVLLHVRDSKWNELPVKTQNDIAVQLYWTYDEIGRSIVTTPVAIQHQLLQTHPSFKIDQARGQAYFEVVPTSIGVNSFVTYIAGGKAACAACTLKFVPGPYVWENTRLWVWHPSLNIYYDDLQPSSSVFNDKPFSILAVLRDKYNNVIDENPFNFQIVMSGHNMVPLNFTACNQTYKFGKKYTACTNELAHSFMHLVGKLGYTVTITHDTDKTKAPITRKLDVVSAWDDSDAGNGPFVPSYTQWWPYLNHPYIYAGQENYYFIVLLRNSEGKRFNDWIDTSRISVRVFDHATGVELTNDKTKASIWTNVYWKWGYYAVGSNIKKAGTIRYQLTIDGNTISNGNYYVTVKPWVPDNGYIQTDVLQGNKGALFKEGCVEYTQYFTWYVYDQYGNPSDYAANRLHLEIKGANDLYWSPTMTKDSSVQGKYYVSWNTPYAMNYTINSYYFRNNAAGKNYYVYMRPGFPSRTTSYSQLLLDPSKGTTLVATDVIHFAIRPRDRFGNDIPTEHFVGKTDNFTLTYIDPKTQTHVQMTNNTHGKNLLGKVYNAASVFVIWTETLNRAGTTSFRPLLKGQSVTCSVCSILVDPNVGYFPNVEISLLQNGATKAVQPTDSITLNNWETYPIFTLQMADIVHNLRTIDAGWSNFKAALEHTGNSSRYNYTLTPAIWASGMKFAFQTLDPQIENYKESVYNKEWTLKFSAVKNGQTFLKEFPNILMYGQGPNADRDFDNADIDPTQSVVVPAYTTLEAGRSAMVTLQVRTKNGKIRKDTYANIASAIQVSVTPAHTAIRTSVRSAGCYGHYIITLYGEKAQNYTINVKIMDDYNNMRAITQQPILNIYPSYLDHSILQSDQNDAAGNPIPLTVDYNYTFTLTPYDRFKNVIYNIAATYAGVSVTPKNSYSCLNTIGRTLLSSGLYQYTITQKTVGTVLLRASYLRNADNLPINSLELTFKPGKFHTVQSIGTLIPDEINAGQSYVLKLYPRDQYGNTIYIDDDTQEPSDVAGRKLSLIHTYPNGTNVNLKAEPFITYWKFDPNVAITRAGDHKFTLTYDDVPVTLSKSILKVWPLPADFGSTQLFHYDLAKNIQTEYDGNSFEFDAGQLPTVAVILNDQYNNTIVEFPKTWDMKVYIRDRAEQLDRIMMCASGNKFSICPADKPTWYTLAPSVSYSIFVTWGTSGKKYWNFKLFGFNESDSDLSNYPLSVQNSILSPTTEQSVTAGQNLTFFIELRTVDGGRKALVFENPDQNITFEIDGLVQGTDFNVSSTEGDKDGRYLTTLSIFKASPALAPYKARLVLANTLYDTAIPKVTVTPGSYNYSVAVSANLSYAFPKGVTTLESGTTDYTYNFYFQAVDFYGNNVPLALADIGFSLVDPLGNLTIATPALLSPGLVKGSFQPTLTGEYTLVTKGTNFTFTILPGTPDATYTNSTIDHTEALAAGTNFTFTINTFDRYGNPAEVTEELTTLFKVYYKQDADLFYQYATFVPGSINGNTLKFTANVTAQGKYQLFATLSGLDLLCQTCAMTVVPGPIYPLSSRLSYYDFKGQQFVHWSRDNLLKEENKIYTPVYQLQVADVFGNVYADFPESYVSSVSFKLTAPADNAEALPAPGYVTYYASLTEGMMFVNVSHESNSTYIGGSQVNGTYTLTATIGGVAIPYQVFLVGAGASDLDASYGPLDINSTYISRESIVTSVTTHELIMVELRTAEGKRKKDVAFPNITLEFVYPDALTNYTVSDGDKPGRYLISVQTNRSYPAFAEQKISYWINGDLCNTTTSWVVAPGPTRYIVNITDLSVLGSTDRDYNIQIIPRDEFNNTANAVPEDIYVTFLTPDDSPIQYSAKTDSMGIIHYDIQAKVAGEYSFISWMFTDGQNNKFFKIKPGVISGERSNATIEVSETVAGNIVKLYVFPKDQYGNLIDSNDTAVRTAFAISYSLNESPDEVSYPLNFNPATNPDFKGAIYANLTFTQAGNYKFFVQSSQTMIPCTNSCALYVKFDKPELTNTKFLVFEGNNVFKETTLATMQAGSNNINIDVNIYDKHNNLVTSYTDQQRFLAVWFGHNMTQIVLNSTITNGDLALSVPEDVQKNVSWLVPGSDYTIQLFYQEWDIVANNFLNMSNITLQLQINGVASDAGNGPMVPQHAKIDVTSNKISNQSAYINMTAGTEVSFVLTLRTINDQRYNEDFDPKDISVTAKNQANWHFSWYSTGAKNVYTIYAQTNKSTELETLTVFVDGVAVGQPINVQVNPNVPDLSKTVLHRPTEVKNHEIFDIVFELYDEYGNQFYNSWTLANFTATVNSGNVHIVNEHPFKLANNSLTIQVVPSYPPMTFNLELSYSIDGTQTVSVFGEPLTFTVTPILDPYRTEVTADIFTTGITSDQEIVYTVYLHDTEGYCYEPLVNFTTSVSGPYASADPSSDELIGGSLTVNEFATPVAVAQETSDATSCQMLYSVSFPAGTAMTAGYYRIQVLMEDETGTSITVYNQKVLRVVAGPMFAPKSAIFVPGRENLGSQPWTLQVGIPFTFFLQAYDVNTNIITEARPDQVGVSLDSEYYNASTNYFANGTWAITLVINKTGEYPASLINFQVNGDVVNAANVQSTNFPTSFILTPGDCSQVNPVITPNFNDGIVLVGETSSYILTCHDVFGNRVVKGGAQFRASVQGNQLDIVGSDILTTTVTDNNDGTYTVSFQPSWYGVYIAYFFITESANSADANYGLPQSFTAIWDKCNVTHPYLCPNVDKCVNSYVQCDGLIPVDKCPDAMKPIACTKNGIEDQCVEAQELCDVPDGYTTCLPFGDNKIVPTNKVEDYCPAYGLAGYCGSDVQCPDTTCRKDYSDCASPSLCPVGYTRCLDNTCVREANECPEFQPCDPNSDYPIRCATMECVADISECPSRVTCAPGFYVCLTDNSCVQSASQCKPPSPSGPPTRFTCSYEAPTLCPTGECVATFSLCPEPTPSSRRLLEEETGLVQILDGGCPAPKKRCPGGECVFSEILCPKVLNCPPNTIRCSDNTCAASASLCYSASCTGANSVQCWNGMCVDDQAKCPTRSSCPNSKPVKCHDGSCADELSNCPEYVACPAYLPVRCDSGDCRQHKSDCPTIPTCPESMPILCQDGSCRKSVQYCEGPSNVVVPAGKIRCPDGSFAFSFSLCPTGVTCARGYVKCWDGACVADLATCSKPSDTYNGALRCPDGSVRTDLKDCPTRRICPPSSPVLCDDGNCKQSSSQCVANTCPSGLRLCPDGTCALSSCGTPITCSTDAPYKCYDNTCRSDPRDCPTPTVCPKSSPILCGDGTCVQDRMFCKPLQACDSATPVRCPNMACATSVDACTTLNVCPQGSITCEDGTCAPDATKCKPVTCPPHLSFKCPDGFCVADKGDCDLTDNACPADKPLKCQDGLCVIKLSDCKTDAAHLACPSGATLCPDGSCAPNGQCPLANGCPAATPLRCASGDCIDPKARNCTITKCPADAPVKCLNGLCAKSNLFCIASFSNEDAQTCASDPNGNIVPCADGRCVSSSDLCRPVLPCPSGQTVRCDDGSCRAVKSQCPKANSCPAGRSYRCASGVCAKDSSYCPQPNGCPTFASTKCSLTGDCALNQTVCETIYNSTLLPNNCTAKNPYLCSTGDCVASKSSCPKIRDCPDGEYLCPDKNCRPFWRYDPLFPESAENNCLGAKNFCPPTSFVCPDLSCKTQWSECKAKNKCPINTPFKCSDGTCKAEPTGPNGCAPSITCSDRTPFLCADGTCAGDPTLCKVLPPCPADSPLRCPDRSCTNNLNTCNSQVICPATTPILCKTGGCVAQVIECGAGKDALLCSESTPFPCASGICVNHPLKCFMGTAVQETATVASRRLLDELAMSNSSNYNCPSSTHRCADGTCRANIGDCPIAEGCYDLSKPYRCSSGRCAASEAECLGDFVQTCSAGQARCEDGLCRDSCFAYNGCPLSRPLQCPDGYCGVNIGECSGESSCDNDKPFRCADGTCAASFLDCSRPIRTFKPADIQVAVSPFSSQTIDFIHSNDSFIAYATLTIPSGAFVSNTQSSSAAQYTGFFIRPVPDSLLVGLNSTLLVGSEVKAQRLFPLVQSQLAFHQAVRSAAVNFTVDSTAKSTYKFAPLLKITFDAPSSSVDVSDYCLGLVVNGSWVCTSRNYTAYDAEASTISFLIPKDGIYAILYNPLPAPQAVLQDDCTSWACKNKVATLAIAIGSVAVFCIVAYYMHRIYRYQVKYREHKVTLANYKAKIEELKTTKTNVYGQTLRDKVEGISFVSNPLYEKYLQETIANQETRYTELELALEKKKVEDKEFESTHKKLSSENRLLSQELQKMKNQLAAQNLKKNDKFKVTKSIKVSEFL